MPKTRIVIAGARVMARGSDPHRPEVADIVIEDGTITGLGAGLAAGAEDATVIDGADRLAIPGFINAHYHSHDVLAKGTMEEEPLETWRLLALPPQYPPRSRAEIRARTLLGAYECLRSGMTTVQDMVTLFPFDPDHLQAVIEAYQEIGVRAVIGLQYADIKGIDTIPHWREVFPAELHGQLSTAAEPDKRYDVLSYIEDTYLKNGTPGGRISWALGPSAPERCSPQLLARTRALSERYDLPIFTHIYESKGMALQARKEYPQHGGSLIRRLQSEGLLGPRLNLAHSVWLRDDEIAMLAETGTNVVLNPLSNSKLKSGLPPIRALQHAAVNVALGCDNCSCSDAQNMFQAMKLATAMVALSHIEAQPPQAEPTFRAATEGGARAIGRAHDLGALAPGYRADIVLLDLTDPTFVPLNSAVRQLVYTESSRGVDTVIVDGQIIVANGRLAGMADTALLAEVEAVMPAFRADFADIAARVARLRPYLEEAHRRIWAEDVGLNRLFTGR